MRRPLVPVLAALLIVTAGFALGSCGGDEATDTTETSQPTTQTTTTTETTPPPERPTTIRVRVVGGVPEGGRIVRRSVKKGDRVVLIVTSDVSDHMHVHGYDLMRDVGPGMRARIAFRAKVPGRFVIELEDRHAQIAELTVEP